jgi:hypothetical protein
MLVASPETINKAVALARRVRHLELSGGVTIEQMDSLSEEIEVAIEFGKQEVANYHNSLNSLKSMPGSSGALPIGF